MHTGPKPLTPAQALFAVLSMHITREIALYLSAGGSQPHCFLIPMITPPIILIAKIPQYFEKGMHKLCGSPNRRLWTSMLLFTGGAAAESINLIAGSTADTELKKNCFAIVWGVAALESLAVWALTRQEDSATFPHEKLAVVGAATVATQALSMLIGVLIKDFKWPLLEATGGMAAVVILYGAVEFLIGRRDLSTLARLRNTPDTVRDTVYGVSASFLLSAGLKLLYDYLGYSLSASSLAMGASLAAAVILPVVNTRLIGPLVAKCKEAGTESQLSGISESIIVAAASLLGVTIGQYINALAGDSLTPWEGDAVLATSALSLFVLGRCAAKCIVRDVNTTAQKVGNALFSWCWWGAAPANQVPLLKGPEKV